MTFDRAASSPFAQLKSISMSLVEGNEAGARSEFIRFLDLHHGDPRLQPAIDSLSVRLGLFPYISGEPSDLSERDAVALAYHSPRVLHAPKFSFHAEQQRVFERLLDGENVVLSAPTSFGKSVVVDALVSSGRWDNLVLIVPTIALVDETRRRLASLRSQYTIVSSTTQARGDKNIFVLTQERFLELEPPPKVDFFVIDEFYKLGDGEKEDQRRSTLNIAWRQLRATGAQYYLIGPNIDRLSEDVDPELRDALYVSDYNTVVVDIEDRSEIADPQDDLKRFLAVEAAGATLVFVSSPSRANKLAVDVSTFTTDSLVLDIATWIGENYDHEWFVAKALAGGVGCHTGPMPRSLQRAMIRLFAMQRIDVLVCTTTLIEGVNTVAKNVVVFDKKIDRKPIDFFTFSNIRGRAGRMLKHFVGRVISYAPLPERVESSVDIPIESQSPLASLATLVQLEPEELTPESTARLKDVLAQRDLSLETIRRNRGLDPERQVEAARLLRSSTASNFDKYSWSGAPKYDELLSVVELGYNVLLEGKQRRGVNPKSIVSRLNAARKAAGHVPELVENAWQFRHEGQSRSDVVDDVLAFQRNWMGFTLPSILRAVSSIQKEVAADRPGARASNYEFLIREIESLYLPPFMADLDEYGLPLPLALKLNRFGLRGDSIESVVQRLAEMADDRRVLARLSRAERWFLSDVAAGLSRELNVAPASGAGASAEPVP